MKRLGKMCIRDSAWAAQEHPVLKRPALRLDAPLALSGLKEEDVAALSVLAPFGHGNPTPVFLVENAVIDAVYPPVSYTHLDVYKRQPQCWPCCFGLLS